LDYRAIPFPFDYYEADPEIYRDNMLYPQNNFRSRFGSPDLTWSDELATFAASWTDTCQYFSSKHDDPNVPW
jgi:hypothetical protein